MQTVSAQPSTALTTVSHTDTSSLPAAGDITSWSTTPASLRCAWSLALGLIAGWLAIGACGAWVVSLQTVVVWLLLLVMTMLSQPQVKTKVAVAGAGAGAVLALLLIAQFFGPSTFQLPLAVVAVVGLVAMGKSGTQRSLFLTVGSAVLALVLFRVAQLQNPWVWILSDRLGSQLGHATAAITGQSVRIGATFSGIDFLVAMAVFILGACTLVGGRRWVFVLLAIVCVLVVEALYLGILAFSSQITGLLPPVVEPGFSDPYVPPDFCWSTLARQLIPWNLPVLGAILHGAAAVLIIRWTSWRDPGHTAEGRAPWTRSGVLATCVLVGLALLLPVVALLHTQSSRLDGSRILANSQDDIDYPLPEHGRYGRQSAGMFGLLPSFVRSLGGEFEKTAEPSSRSLQEADVLLLLHPNETFSRWERIRQYVKDGGSVLIVADGFDPEPGPNPWMDALLAETAITVSRDAAVSETGNWQGAYLPNLHAATSRAGLPSTRFLSDGGASLRLKWGARPLVIGQWGWSAPRQGATWDDAPPLQTGAKLGDLVLAAEHRLGKGKIVVLGSNRALNNEGLVRGFEFMGDLLAYLAHDHGGPQGWPRRLVGLFCCLAIPVFMLQRRHLASLLAVSLILTAGVGISTAWSRHAARVLPDRAELLAPDERGAGSGVSRIAYIDQSHLEAYNFQDWGYDAINGLTLNLMRNGYMPLLLPRLTPERLARTDLLVSIGPAEEFSRRDRQTVKSFVERGGTLICMVGAEDAAPSASLLSEFGLNVPGSPVPTGGGWPEPEPFGKIRTFYLNVEMENGENYQAAVRLHAAWPVESTDGKGEVVAYGRNQLSNVESDTELPVILLRDFGSGNVVLIGDTNFAMNKNLEYVNGEPFAGGYDNAHFWRWLISRLTDRPEWIPPPAASEETAEPTGDDS